MGTKISDALLEGSLEYTHSCSDNARHCLIQFKLQHRLHSSKETYTLRCPLYVTALWQTPCCFTALLYVPRLRSFSSLSKILYTQLKPEPLIIILRMSDNVKKTELPAMFLHFYSLIIAKKLLLMHLKKKEAPTAKMSLSGLPNTLHLERIRYFYG